jgi:hypothetical protein
MLVHIHDLDQFQLAALALDVDGSVSLAESYRALTLPLALQGLVMEPFELADISNAALLDESYPDPELSNDQLRDAGKLLVYRFSPSDLGRC